MTARDLVEEYRTAFARGDLAALLGCFAFPVQVVSTVGPRASVSAFDRDGWSAVLGGLLGAYARLGVADALPLATEVGEPVDGVSVVRVHWALQRADGRPVYEFTAAYTLARVTDGLRIVAVVHDEVPKLRTAMS